MLGNITTSFNSDFSPLFSPNVLFMKLIFILTAIIIFSVFASAYPDDYSPFAKNPPKLCKMAELRNKSSDLADETMIATNSKADFLNLKFSHSDSYFKAVISMKTKNGVEILKPTIVSDFCCLDRVFTKDFNGDEKPDFVLTLHSVMNGLGASRNDVVFLLSNGSKYAAKTIKSFAVGEKDFVSLKSDNSCQFVHTEMDILDSSDGKRHAHWIYNLLEFSETNLRPANNLSSNFPKFIWYTQKPNKRRTKFIPRNFQETWIDENLKNIFF